MVELHGINGLAVAKRCALLASPGKRELVWFIQGLSIQQGKGLGWLADGLLSGFADRIDVTPENRGLADMLEEFDLAQPPQSQEDIRRTRTAKVRAALPRFLIDFCIDPAIRFSIPGENPCEEQEALMMEWQLGGRVYQKEAQLEYFQDIVGALVEFKRRYEADIRKQTLLTAIGRKVWRQLDDMLKLRTLGMILGREGRGKTVAAQAWCDCHLGRARFVSLKGVSTKTTQFRAMSLALGVTHGSSRKSGEMQAGVEEVLRLSGLMPVIDEAHFFFNQGPRMYTRPEMLDWIDTALCNPPLPVALIATPQFLDCIQKAAVQTGWNYLQFKRRCKRLEVLPDKNTVADIEAVARKLAPGATTPAIKEIVGYAMLSRRDLSAVGDVVREAKLLAEQTGADTLTYDHIKSAVHEVLLPSDQPWAELDRRIKEARPGRQAWRRDAPAVELGVADKVDQVPARQIVPADPAELPTPRRGTRISALIGEPEVTA
jgi:hypothetical protein